MHQIGASDIRTFSIGFEEESHNELPYARRVAEHYGTKHEDLVVRPDALEIIPRLARSFDEPYADSSAIPSWYLADMTRQHVVVALNGDGGDEALGGYTRYLRYLTSGGRRLPRPLARGLSQAGTMLRQHSARSPYIRKAANAAMLLGEADPADRYARFLSYFRPDEKLDIAAPEFAPGDARQRQLRAGARPVEAALRHRRHQPTAGSGHSFLPSGRSAPEGRHHDDVCFSRGAQPLPRSSLP
jgi:asparagine synthase (glutamine-hydrolysing)